MIKKILNNAGMSLVEILVALGVSGAVAVGIASITNMQIQSKNLIEKELAINEHYIEILNFIRQPNNCAFNFGSLTLDKSAINTFTDLKLPSGKVIAEEGNNTGVTISELSIEFLEDLGFGSQFLYQMKITYSVNEKRKVNKFIKLIFKEDVSGTIGSCGVSPNLDLDLARRLNCEDLGGTYTAGNCQLNGVQLGSRALCNPTNEGVLRYTTSVGCPEICDNTGAWRNICGVTPPPVTPPPVAPPPVTPPPPTLAGACASIGGTLRDAGGTEVCRISGASCPTGWRRFSNWGSYGTRTCNGRSGSGTGLCGSYSLTGTSKTVGPAAWQNGAPFSYVWDYQGRSITTSSHPTNVNCSVGADCTDAIACSEWSSSYGGLISVNSRRCLSNRCTYRVDQDRMVRYSCRAPVLAVGCVLR